MVRTFDAIGNFGTTERDVRGLVTRITDARGNVTNLSYDVRGNPVRIDDGVGVPIEGTDASVNLFPNQSLEARARGFFVAVGDINNNNDGHLDIVGTHNDVNVSNNTLGIYLNNGDGTFAARTNIGSGGNDPRRVQLADVNGDGTFAPKREFAAATGAYRQAFGDFDLDGDLDVLLGTRFEGAAVILRNQTVSTQLRSGPGVKLFSYDPVFNQVVREINEVGHENRYQIDPTNGNILSATRIVGLPGGADDLVTTFTYNARGQILTRTDPAGRVTEFEYDALGHKVRETLAKGTADEATTRFEYDLAGNVKAILDALGRRTEFEYDLMNRITRILDALGGETRFEYDAAGNQIARINALGVTTRYEYDEQNRNIREIDALGGVTSVVYSQTGKILEQTDALGRITRFKYDARDRLIERIDSAGGVRRYSYDLDNNLISTTDPTGATTIQTVDSRGRVTQIVDALGNSTRFLYDGADQLVGEVDARNNITRLFYDDLGQLVRTVDALGGEERRTYDRVSNLTSTTDALGRTTTYVLDARDRLTHVIDPAGGVIVTTYDAVSNVLTVTDQNGGVRRYEYDALNRRIKDTDTLGNETQVTYDAVGNLTTLTNARGFTSTRQYDALNRLVQFTDALGGVVTTTYDALGRVIARTDPLGRTTQFEYDALGNLNQITDALGNVTRFEHDARSQMTALRDALGNTTRFEYDALGRNTRIIDALGGVNVREYDANGNRVAEVDPLGNRSVTEYDALNRPFRGTDALGNVSTFVLDAVGQVVAAIDALGRTTTFEYDSRGNRTRENRPLGRFVVYTYDANSRMSRVTQTGPGVAEKRVDFRYDAVGQYVGIDRFADVAGTTLIGTTQYTFDLGGRPTEVSHVRGGTTFNAFTSQFDAANQLIQRTSNDGVSNFTFDAQQQLTAADHSFQADEAYNYDETGNRVGGDITIGPSNRLLVDGALVYEYDVEGNRTRMTNTVTGNVTEYSYDHRNRLIGVTVRSSDNAVLMQASYAYDGYNRRIARTVDADGDGPGAATTFRYVWEGNHPTLVFDGNGTLLRRALVGNVVDQILAEGVDAVLGNGVFDTTTAIVQGTANGIANSATFGTFDHVREALVGDTGTQSTAFKVANIVSDVGFSLAPMFIPGQQAKLAARGEQLAANVAQLQKGAVKLAKRVNGKNPQLVANAFRDLDNARRLLLLNQLGKPFAIAQAIGQPVRGIVDALKLLLGPCPSNGDLALGGIFLALGGLGLKGGIQQAKGAINALRNPPQLANKPSLMDDPAIKAFILKNPLHVLGDNDIDLIRQAAAAGFGTDVGAFQKAQPAAQFAAAENARLIQQELDALRLAEKIEDFQKGIGQANAALKAQLPDIQANFGLMDADLKDAIGGLGRALGLSADDAAEIVRIQGLDALDLGELAKFLATPLKPKVGGGPTQEVLDFFNNL